MSLPTTTFKMSTGRFLTSNNILLAAGFGAAATYVGLYVYRASGERIYPTRRLSELPRACAIRTLHEEHTQPTALDPNSTWTVQPVFVEPRGRWLPTFVAPSYTLPRTTLERYAHARLDVAEGERLDAQTMMHAAATALFDSIPHRLEVRFGVRTAEAFDIKDGELPRDARTALRPGRGHWNNDFIIFDSWSTSPPAATHPEHLQEVVAAGRVPEPPCTMPSNAKRLIIAVGEPNAAGVLLYWRREKLRDYRLMNLWLRAASSLFSLGIPLGGFHELIVEDVPERNEGVEELVRITYATTEVYDLHRSGKEENRRILPGWAWNLHADYARSMLNGAINLIETHP